MKIKIPGASSGHFKPAGRVRPRSSLHPGATATSPWNFSCRPTKPEPFDGLTVQDKLRGIKPTRN